MIEVFERAADLSEDWDSLSGDNPYIRRSFLAFIEANDPCSQRYAAFRDREGRIDSLAVAYVREGFDLFMFSPIDLMVRMTFVYVPVSVARPGLVLGERTKAEVEAWLASFKGFLLLLNLPPEPGFRGFVRGNACPRCVLGLRWPSFDAYLASHRSAYRHRLRKAQKRAEGLAWERLSDNRLFDDRLYSLYLEVFDRSASKIERLSKEFFQGPRFVIWVLKSGDEELGFVQLLENGTELVFEFVGFDHERNHEFDIYENLLLKIVRHGIEGGFKTIDFGQTADEAKLRLGARYERLYAFLRHSNPVLNFLVHRLARFIEYKPLDEDRFHVFKE